MFDKIKGWIHNMLTEVDNKTVCPVRVTAMGGTLYSFVCHGYATFIQHAPFDMQAFSLGLSAILGTLGLALGVKKDSTPGDK